MILTNTSLMDAPVAVLSPVGKMRSLDGRTSMSGRGMCRLDGVMTGVVNVSPIQVSSEGENRLQGNSGITTGDHAHAAVRMHAVPVKGFFWAYCPKTKTRHSQRSKVAT